jgi:Uma2 family endonuclease
VVGELFGSLRAACPAEREVFVAPLDVVLAEDTVLIPDLLVARRSDLDEMCLPAAPVLAVEVLSPSTRRVNLMLKRSRCEAAGVPSYRVVDPDQPGVLAWQLVDGVHRKSTNVAGDQPFRTDQTFRIEIIPDQLV